MKSSLLSIGTLALLASGSPAFQQVYVSDVSEQVIEKLAPATAHLPFGKPPPTVDLSKYTIGQILNWTLHHPEKADEVERKPGWWPFPAKEKRHTLPIHKFAWLFNRTDDKFQETLYDDEAEITLLVPDDEALSKPHHRGPGKGKGKHHDHHKRERREVADYDEWEHSRPNPLEMSEMMELESAMNRDEENDDDDDDKREKRRKFLRKLLSLLVRYHLLPEGAFSGRELADFATVGTGLHQSRIRTRPSLLPRPTIHFNVYASARLQVKAKNGYIHLISAPLLPPLSPLSEAFVFPQLFSTLTTGVQKVELDEVLAPWLHGHKDDDDSEGVDKVDAVVMSLLGEIVQERVAAHEGKREFTVFAPTNFAFKRLGLKINAFLFSPFGRRILKKVLAYHVVPDLTIFTDHLHNATEGSEQGFFDADLEDAEDFMLPPDEMHGWMAEERTSCHGDAKVYKLEMKTLLPDATLHGKLVEYRRFHGKGPITRDTYVTAGGKQTVKVFIADLPAWGGAIHVINSVLIPPHEHHEGLLSRD